LPQDRGERSAIADNVLDRQFRAEAPNQKWAADPMADNLQRRGGRDRARINVNEDRELRDWAEKFGVSPDALKKAVAAVGDKADAVEQHLKGERKGANVIWGRPGR
jgi:hypothetical protein